MSKRRATIIILIIIILVLIALLIFWLLYSKQGPLGVEFPTPSGEGGPEFPPGEGGLPGEGGVTPGAGAGGGIIMAGTEPPDRYTNYPSAYNRLKRISSLPVAGTIVFDKNAETFIRYVERGSGDLFETRAVTAEEPYRIARTSILKIYEAYWADNGQSVILRYLKSGSDEIQNFYTAIGSKTGDEYELTGGTFLSPSITAFAVSPSTEKIFYVLKSADYSYGIVSNPDGSRRTQIFESPITEWLPFWNDPNYVILATKPSASVLGFAYSLNVKTGEWKRIIGSVTGLTVLPNSDTTALATFRNTLEGSRFGVYYTKDSLVYDWSLRALPEKCVWSKVDDNSIYCTASDNGIYASEPDNWYMGVTSYDDKVWKVNVDTGESTLVFDPEVLVQTQMDMIDLRLDSKDKYLVFQNKKDLSLWLYELEE